MAPSITFPTNGQEFFAYEQTDEIFTCMASGYPAPSISFLYKGQLLDNTERIPMSAGEALADRVMLGNETVIMNTLTGLYEVARSLNIFDVMGNDSGDFYCSSLANIPGIGVMFSDVSFSLLVYCK